MATVHPILNRLPQAAITVEAILREIDLPQGGHYSMNFYSCTFERCNFSSNTFEGCTFSECRFLECDLTMIRIPQCQFNNCDFVECKMMGIDWSVASWRRSVGKKKSHFTLTFDRCVLNYSIFIGMEMVGARFTGCCLHEVGFENTDLRESTFSECDLRGALFSETNLTKADLRSAHTYTINACRNNLTSTRFSLPQAMALLYALGAVIEE